MPMQSQINELEEFGFVLQKKSFAARKLHSHDRNQGSGTDGTERVCPGAATTCLREQP